MAYTKTTWEETTPITTINMNNAESQYSLAYSEAVAHNHDDRYYTTTYTDANYWHKDNDGAESGCDADLIYSTAGNYHFTDFAIAGIVADIIIMWDGVEIPYGWSECNVSPDLRDKFVAGAGLSYGPGGGLGSNTCDSTYTITIQPHKLTVEELTAHAHTWVDGMPGPGGYGASGDVSVYVGVSATTAETSSVEGNDEEHSHGDSWVTQTATPNNNLPPCVALKYIKKNP